MTTPSSQYFSPDGECPHHKTTKKGTNAFVIKETCKDCGAIIRNEKKTEIGTDPQTITASPGETTPEPSPKTAAELREFREFKRWKEQMKKK